MKQRKTGKLNVHSIYFVPVKLFDLFISSLEREIDSTPFPSFRHQT